ncbi:hypothetical protein [Rufibacter latericius]|uniref:Uncharacterized protein n=1 Tax=Rufibacter latericius TaxID=2487040 RepID=A0A3M9MM80_9BACT|nr:hypothetical protein [Rufibacter latericius]RNI26599.1 hypothetical protein EFB08_11310 [Rufibacter latericius]
MSNFPKARTVEQMVSDFMQERPNEPQSLYALVRKYIINARTEVTIEKAELAVSQKYGFQGLDGHPYQDE